MREAIYRIVFACALVIGPSAGATTILDTAISGPTGQTGGRSISADQFLGARFSLTETTKITHFGGHLFGREIFAAFIALDSPTALPSFLGTDIETNVIASTLFNAFDTNEFDRPISGTVEHLEAFELVLGPGDYALVFGDDKFGAQPLFGGGFMADNGVAAPGASMFFWQGFSGSWFDTSQPMRFVIKGKAVTAVPLPGTAPLLFCALAAAGLARLRRRTAT